MTPRNKFVGLMIIGGIAFSWYGFYKAVSHDCSEYESTDKEVVVGKTFAGEEVNVDGKSFQKCRFVNVTLTVTGRRPTDIIDVQFDGGPFIKVQNDRVGGIIKMLEAFKIIEVKTQLFGVDEYGSDIQIKP